MTDELLAFTDRVMAQLVEQEKRIASLEKTVAGIVTGHAGDTRDELKTRLEKLEDKLHMHFEGIRKSPTAEKVV